MTPTVSSSPPPTDVRPKYLRTDDMILDRCRQDCEERGIPWDGRAQRRANALVLAYGTLRADAASRRRPDGRTSYRQLGRRIYGPDVVDTMEDLNRKRSSLHRWFRQLAAWGFIELHLFTINGGGKSGGIDWRLVPIGSEASARSSAG